MVSRSGIGATLAAAVIFSTLLVTNAAIISASQQEEALTARADAESYLSSQAAALDGTLGITLLDRLQNYLSAHIFICGNATTAVQAEVETLSASQRVGPLLATGALANGLNETLPDNLTSIAPFAGWREGELNIAYTTRITGSLPSVGVGFESDQTHSVSVPVTLDAMAAACMVSLSEATASLANEALTRCNSSRIGELLGSIPTRQEESTEGAGLNVMVAYSVSFSAQCLVRVTTTVTQADIQGPAGAFSVSAEEGATVLVSLANATASA